MKLLIFFFTSRYLQFHTSKLIFRESEWDSQTHFSGTTAITSNYFLTYILPLLKIKSSKYHFHSYTHSCHNFQIHTVYFSLKNSPTEDTGTLSIIYLNSNTCSVSTNMKANIFLLDNSYLVSGLSMMQQIMTCSPESLRKLEMSHTNLCQTFSKNWSVMGSER